MKIALPHDGAERISGKSYSCKVANISDAERRDIQRRGHDGEALFLWELAVFLGYGYSTILKWKREGLPLVDGKIPAKEAWAWRKRFVQAEASASQ